MRLAPNLLRTMRPHQWVKNILLFCPLLLAHEIDNPKKFLSLGCAFLLMCLGASGTYLLNDVLDLEADRLHPVKKSRPVASGALPAGAALAAAFMLIGTGLGASLWFVGGQFTLMFGLYTLLTIAYSLWLKRLLIVDVIALSFFYTLRLLIGGTAVSVPVSPWLLACSWFFFLSLAFVKRFVEIRVCEELEGQTANGRSYLHGDLLLIQVAGIACGLSSVLVLLLYIATSDQVKILYANPLWLWMIAPLLVYWLMRTWFLAERNKMDPDPVSFAIKDGASWGTAALIGALLVLGSVT